MREGGYLAVRVKRWGGSYPKQGISFRILAHTQNRVFQLKKEMRGVDKSNELMSIPWLFSGMSSVQMHLVGEQAR